MCAYKCNQTKIDTYSNQTAKIWKCIGYQLKKNVDKILIQDNPFSGKWAMYTKSSIFAQPRPKPRMARGKNLKQNKITIFLR